MIIVHECLGVVDVAKGNKKDMKIDQVMNVLVNILVMKSITWKMKSKI